MLTRAEKTVHVDANKIAKWKWESRYFLLSSDTLMVNSYPNLGKVLALIPPSGQGLPKTLTTPCTSHPSLSVTRLTIQSIYYLFYLTIVIFCLCEDVNSARVRLPAPFPPVFLDPTTDNPIVSTQFVE